MKEIAYLTKDSILKKDWRLLGSLMDENWKLKKQLSTNISTFIIDQYYSKAITAGAYGGKLIGAGGTGFLLFVVPPERRNSVKTALSLKEHYFSFETSGSRVVYEE